MIYDYVFYFYSVTTLSKTILAVAKIDTSSKADSKISWVTSTLLLVGNDAGVSSNAYMISSYSCVPTLGEQGDEYDIFAKWNVKFLCAST